MNKDEKILQLEQQIKGLTDSVNYLYLKVERLYEILITGGPRTTDGDASAFYNLRDRAKAILAAGDSRARGVLSASDAE